MILGKGIFMTQYGWLPNNRTTWLICLEQPSFFVTSDIFWLFLTCVVALFRVAEMPCYNLIIWLWFRTPGKNYSTRTSQYFKKEPSFFIFFPKHHCLSMFKLKSFSRLTAVHGCTTSLHNGIQRRDQGRKGLFWLAQLEWSWDILSENRQFHYFKLNIIFIIFTWFSVV